jgi:hypothetical protein
MGFYEENKNFIKQKFYSEMRELDLSAKTENYNNLLKQDTRKRLLNSYNNCSDSKTFFMECIEVLHHYEFPFLFINLFFEENFEDIIVLLDHTKFIETKEHSNNLLVKRFLNYINKLKDFREFKAEEFLKSEFLDVVGIEETIWINKSIWPNNNFLKIYAEWIINSLKESEDIVIYSAILFNKIWIDDIGFIGDHKTSKAIIFLHSLIQRFDNEIKKNNFININSFYEKLNTILDEVFVSGYFSTPLTDNSIEDFYGAGYYEKLKIFKEKIFFSKNLHTSYNDYSYYELFLRLAEPAIDAFSKQNITSQIYLKLDGTVLPTEDELNSINVIMGDDLFKKNKIDFFSKLYRFELL